MIPASRRRDGEREGVVGGVDRARVSLARRQQTLSAGQRERNGLVVDGEAVMKVSVSCAVAVPAGAEAPDSKSGHTGT